MLFAGAAIFSYAVFAVVMAADNESMKQERSWLERVIRQKWRATIASTGHSATKNSKTAEPLQQSGAAA